MDEIHRAKWASIWLGATRAVAVTFNETIEGHRVAAESVGTSIDARGSLARVAMRALDASRSGLPPVTAEALKASREELLRAAGVRTRKALHQQFKVLHLEVEAAALNVIPTRDGGFSGDDRGYHFLVPIRLPWPCDLDALDEALREAARGCC